MKRKLIQVEKDDLDNPTKLHHVDTSYQSATMESLERSLTFGRPKLSSTPQASSRASLQSRDFNRARFQSQSPQQQAAPIDPGAEFELRKVVDNFVNIYEQLDKCAGKDVKPNYSYTELAYLAMLRSPNFCLPITEIYRYIQSRFLFFKNSTRKHWKNAVRHSLAKTLCFTKIPVGRGKSNSENLSRAVYLWCILPGSIASFARGDYRPNVDKESGTNTLRWGYFQMNAGQFWDQVGNFISYKMSAFKTSLETSPSPGYMFEQQVCTLPGETSQAQLRQPLVQCHNYIDFNSHQQNLPPLNIKQDRHVDRCHIQSVSPMSYSGGSVKQSQHIGGYHDNYSRALSPQSPPSMSDPWLPTMHLASPDSSLSSIESDRRTPPSCSFDSGNETYDYSPEKSSCRFSSSCAVTNSEKCISPLTDCKMDGRVLDDSGFNQIEQEQLGQVDFMYFSKFPQQQLGYSLPFAGIQSIQDVGTSLQPSFLAPNTPYLHHNRQTEYELFHDNYSHSYDSGQNRCVMGNAYH